MERISNNEFRRRSMPDRTQYLKDCDDDNTNNFRVLNGKLKALIWLVSAIVLMFVGYFVDSIFLN